MAQNTTGIHALLSASFVYETYQRLVGARRHDRKVVTDYIKPFPGCRILDVGCGPARILDELQGADYLGIDLSPEYIDTARARYGTRARFRVVDAKELAALNEGPFDVALCLGVLHHLDDETALNVFGSVAPSLSTGGKMIAVEPCFLDNQSLIARFIIANDRGKNVRRVEDYERLARSFFSRVDCEVRHDLLRIPYTQVVLSCQN